MNKQVYTPPEQVPEQIPGQLTVEEVLSPTESGTQTNDTHAADPVREPIASQQGANGCVSDDNQPCEQVPNNVTPITHARAKRTKQKSASQVQNGQSVQIDQTRLKSPENALKCDADKTGAEIVKSGAKAVGRPKGAKDKHPRKIRYDNSFETSMTEVDRGRIVKHNLELWRLGKLKDRNNVNEVRDRVETYFYICSKNNVMPTVAGFALALGIDRTTLWLWLDNKTGVIKNPEVLDALKEVYSMINAQYEALLTEGKGIPASSFFLMKNNYGYKDVQDHVVIAQQAEEPDTGEIAARAGLLDGDD